MRRESESFDSSSYRPWDTYRCRDASQTVVWSWNIAPEKRETSKPEIQTEKEHAQQTEKRRLRRVETTSAALRERETNRRVAKSNGNKRLLQAKKNTTDDGRSITYNKDQENNKAARELWPSATQQSREREKSDLIMEHRRERAATNMNILAKETTRAMPRLAEKESVTWASVVERPLRKGTHT